MTKELQYDVIIIGGSYAGLSAAMALGRSIRKTLIIDGGDPCNKQTPQSHNFLTQDGETPAAIAEKALEQVLKYPTVELLQGFVVELEQQDNVFVVTTAAGERFAGMKILLATGVKDELCDIPGFAECWGISVLHCPYCHGYEVRQQKTAILAKGEEAYHLGLLLHNWASDITLLSDGDHGLEDIQLDLLKANSVELIDEKVTALKHEDGRLKSIQFESGKTMPVEVMYSRVPFTLHSEIASQIGCDLSESGHILVDASQKTTIPGIYAAGDCTTNGRAVSIAVAAGSRAGMMINSELIFGQVKK